MVHAHTLSARGKSVLNVFNLADIEVEKEIHFTTGDIGLEIPPKGQVIVAGCPSRIDGKHITLYVRVPARGQRLLELEVGKKE